MYQIIFIDIDGTLLCRNKLISQQNITAIEKAKKKGIKICLATGRNYLSAKKIVKQIKPDYLISSNGFSIYDVSQKRCLTNIFEKLYFIFLTILYLDYKISKGKALKKLCKYLNIPINCSISIGNQTNDISMIKSSGLGCCTANAEISLKKVSNYICTNTNNKSAVCEVINKFCL